MLLLGDHVTVLAHAYIALDSPVWDDMWSRREHMFLAKTSGCSYITQRFI